MATKLGEKIRKLRKAKNLTLEKLGAETGSSKSYMWELENGPAIRPSAEKITAIAKVLGVTPEFLLDEDRKDATSSVRDQAFFRKYQVLDEVKKRKVEEILKLLDDDA